MKPDKLPTLDPRQPDLYKRILDAAAQVRAERQSVNVLAWAAIRSARIDDLRNVNRREDSGPVIWVSPEPQ